MAITSRYVQLSNWALLEYVYESEAITTTLAKTWLIENKYINTNVFLNGNESLMVTENVLDTTSNNMTNMNIWSYNNVDAAIPIINNDSNLILSQTALGAPDVQYDTVKIHLIAGFNFDLLDGFILKISVEEKSGRFVDLTNYTFLKGQDKHINFNSSPIILGDRIYDRYVDVKIPSLKWIQETAADANSFSKIYTSDSFGFVYNPLINATLFEIKKSKNIAGGNVEFETSNEYPVSFLPQDTYSSFTAVIEEPTNADYFELYGLWEGQFMEDYIADLNSVGGNWSLIHSYTINEQIGPDIIKTADVTQFQNDNFDQPLLVRPVILNSAIAFSFSIDYTLRLYNSNDGTQIIRKSSITSYEPKKYGKQLEKINVNREFTPTKIYNKIAGSGDINLSSDLFQQNLLGSQPQLVEKYIPTYYSHDSISVSVKENEAGNFGSVIYGQSKAWILLNEFDNILRFKLYEKDNAGATQELELPGTSDIKIAFTLKDENKVYISRNTETSLDITSGEIEFKIPSKTAKSILSNSNKSFYIISSTIGSNETVLYQGWYDSIENSASVNAALIGADDADITSKLDHLNELRKKTEVEERRLVELRNTSITVKPSKPKLNLNRKTQVNTSKIMAGYIDTLNNDDGAIIREIPGVTLDLSSDIVTDVTPEDYVPPYTAGGFHPDIDP